MVHGEVAGLKNGEPVMAGVVGGQQQTAVNQPMDSMIATSQVTTTYLLSQLLT